MNVLVTGATGFIGRRLVERLVRDKHEVKALVRSESAPSWLADRGVKVVRGDIQDTEAVRRAVEGCQTVFHLAANMDSAARKDVFETNVRGTENIAAAAARERVDRLVFCSSASVYGRVVRNRAINEQTRLRPDTPYGESKLLAERIVLGQNGQLPAVVTRFTTVWGAGMQNWIGLFQSIASGQFRLVGNGANHHHVVDVRDLVEGLLLCGSVQNIERRTYILAGPEPVQLRDLVRLIGNELGVTSFPPNLPAAPLRAYKVFDHLASALLGRNLPRADRLAMFLGDRIFDNSRARAELGYSPQISLGQTVHTVVEWLRSQGKLLQLRGDVVSECF